MSEDYLADELDEQALLDDVKVEVKEEDDGDDLYDAAIEPSGLNEKRESVDNSNVAGIPSNAVTANSGLVPTQATSNTSVASGPSSNRRFQLYVGNMTWWTTDEDLMRVVESYGVTDVIDVRFAENRQNGQSRGFATVIVGSETSGKTLMDRLPGRQLHGNLLSALPFNKTSLQRLEEATRSSAPQEKKEDKSNIPNLGTVRIGPRAPMVMNRPMQMMGPMNGMVTVPLMGYPNQMPMNMMPQARVVMAGPPGVQPHSNINTVQTMNNLMRNNQPNMPPGAGMIPPGAHVNPNVYPQFGQPNQMRGDGGVSQAEYDEIMSRNKTVSSSAITRAMSDASAGDISSAVSTLNTAISLIRQSKVSGDEACRGLIRTLEDALNSVESKSDHSSRRRHRRDSSSPRRSRSRERSRDSRSHRHSRVKRSRAS